MNQLNPQTTEIITSLLSSLFTKDNITFAIALFGALGTLMTLYQNRFSIVLTYRSHLLLPSSKLGIIFFNFLIENKSQSPVSITRLFISIDDISGEFLHEKHYVSSHTHSSGNDIIKNETYTIPLPAKLEGLGAIGGYFLLQIPQHISEQKLKSSKVTVTVVTNRGKAEFVIHPKDSTMDCLTGTAIHPYQS